MTTLLPMFFIAYHVTLFPSLAIANFLHFSHLGITFTQCATMFPEKNFIVISYYNYYYYYHYYFITHLAALDLLLAISSF